MTIDESKGERQGQETAMSPGRTRPGKRDEVMRVQSDQKRLPSLGETATKLEEND